MDEELSADERKRLRGLYATELDGAAAALEKSGDAADAERITMQLLLHFQYREAPPEAVEDVIAELEERGDAFAATVLATAERLLAPSVAGLAARALVRLRAAGVADEPPEGTGELQIASVRRFRGTDGEIYLARLELNLDQQSVWVFAPSAPRLESAEREVRELAGDLLGEEIERLHEDPAVSHRWQRDRVDATLSDLDLPGLGLSEAA